MSAEALREAASLMRGRAEVASPSPWVKTVWPNAIPGVYSQAIEDTHEFDPEIARTLDEPDAEHIASWHPVVALAVADWLEACAAFEQKLNGGEGKGPTEPEQRWQPHQYKSALAVARAYLGAP